MANKNTCYHCGDECVEEEIGFDEKTFCCNGCKVVYELLQENDLCDYYTIEQTPGLSPKAKSLSKFAYLDNEDVMERLINFKDEELTMVTFNLPQIHCSSCIWLLENLYKLNPSIQSSRVNFLKKEASFSFQHDQLSLRKLVELLTSIGYEPELNLEKTEKKKKKVDRRLVYKIGVAGFCFGNVMLISLPEYFGLDSIKESDFTQFFGYLNIVLALPVILYSASDYFNSAFQGLKQKKINIDVPISLGVLVLFLRSVYEILSKTGAGYMDSLAGLIFFLLLGKIFQQITYSTLSFERDYKSYFPVAITKLMADEETAVSLNEVQEGDILLIKNEEIVPVDAELIEGAASIDNSFVTGESKIANKRVGEKIYAGGKQVGGAIKVKVIRKLSQSYLTQLWNNEAFADNTLDQFEGLTNNISKYFTIVILTIALVSGGYWLQHDFKTALNAFTAVLIIACPCALALAAPFTYGNVLRILGRKQFFLKNAAVIEQLASANSIVFDKTGTLTQSSKSDVQRHSGELNQEQQQAFYSLLRQSSHPLSIILFNTFEKQTLIEVNNYTEVAGSGISASINGNTYKLGSKDYVLGTAGESASGFSTEVYLSENDELCCYYTISNNYRSGLKESIASLRKSFKLRLLTGDNEGEKQRLKEYFNTTDELNFNQTPEDKLNYIKTLQNNSEKVVMIGDGLNDSGALRQSNVGISISEDVNTFSPACDAILDANSFAELPKFIHYCKLSIKVVIASFIISFSYNVVGLYFGVMGMLSPVIAAILMPLSSITVVLFVTVASTLIARSQRIL